MKQIVSYTLSSLCALLLLILTTITSSADAPDKISSATAALGQCPLQWANFDTAAGYENYYEIETISRDDAWALGETDTLGVLGLVRWDGHSWERYPIEFPPPPLSTGYSRLSAWSTDDVWLVGSYLTQDGMQSYVDHWNGLNWSVVASDTVGAPRIIQAQLLGVKAIGPGEAYAVGTNHTSDGPAIAMHCTLDGCAEMPIAIGTEYRSLFDVSAVNANDAWAVGVTTSNSTLILRYDGTQWSVVPSPEVGRLFAVESLASDDVWTTGETGTLHWDGTAWSQVDAPPNLRSFSGLALNDMWAAGTAIWHWDGSTWTLENEESALVVSASAPDNIWAGGFNSDGQLKWYTPTCFTDVAAGSTFFFHVRELTDRAITSGYPCGAPGEPCDSANRPYFRTQNDVTRGQLSKIVTLAAGFEPDPSIETFEDVPIGSTFHPYVQALHAHAAITGFPCGGPGEPCIPPSNRPYFRPNAASSRAQIAKIVAISAGYNDPIDSQTFEDVPIDSTFHLWIENLASRGIINGYPCGGPGEPCVPPNNRPYFRPSNNVTRGQMSKIAAITFFP